MPELIALGYETADLAEAGRDCILRLDPNQLDDVGDAVVASMDFNGVVRLNQATNLWSGADKGAMLWRLLINLLFFHPLLAVIDAEVASRLSYALSDFRITEDDMASIRQQLQPDRAVMFLWLERQAPEGLMSALEQDGTLALRRQIEPSKLPFLQSVFEQARLAARRQRGTAYSGDYVDA